MLTRLRHGLDIHPQGSIVQVTRLVVEAWAWRQTGTHFQVKVAKLIKQRIETGESHAHIMAQLNADLDMRSIEASCSRCNRTAYVWDVERLLYMCVECGAEYPDHPYGQITSAMQTKVTALLAARCI